MTYRRASLSAVLLLLGGAPFQAHATSQWTRKYGVACTTCHSMAFPRLNYQGERFMRNGYQDVGTEDGDVAGKSAVGDRLFIDDLGNLLGVRLNLVPLRIRTNALQDEPGEFTTQVSLGNPDWMQLFVAGSIFKNVSIWIEAEYPSKGEFHFGWFRMGFHNLLGTHALNVWAGILDPLELHAASGRLPMIPAIRQDAFYVQSSGGKGDDSVSLRGGRPAVTVYGAFGSLVYQVGMDNGKSFEDPNPKKNLWGTLRYELTSGLAAGSSLSVWGYRGWDTKNQTAADGTFTGQVENDFWRVSSAANVRTKRLDLLLAYVFGRDDNWTLDPASPREVELHGLLVQAGYAMGSSLHLAAQYDGIFSEDAPEIEVSKVGATLSFLPRENWRIMLVPRLDLLEEGTTHPRRQHDVTVMIRTMI